MPDQFPLTVIRGFHIQRIDAATSDRAAVVLLHGSGGSERSLIDLGWSIAPDRALIAVRGRVPWEGGHAFFTRNPDRTLDGADLAARCAEFCGLLEALDNEGVRKPILLGFSNGAIMAGAAVLQAPRLSGGAILLRPLSPMRAPFPGLDGYPVLVVGGALDDRRDPSDAPRVAGLFRDAGATVTEHILPVGHAPDERDVELARAWLTRLQ